MPRLSESRFSKDFRPADSKVTLLAGCFRTFSVNPGNLQRRLRTWWHAKVDLINWLFFIASLDARASRLCVRGWGITVTKPGALEVCLLWRDINGILFLFAVWCVLFWDCKHKLIQDGTVVSGLSYIESNLPFLVCFFLNKNMTYLNWKTTVPTLINTYVYVFFKHFQSKRDFITFNKFWKLGSQIGTDLKNLQNSF